MAAGKQPTSQSVIRVLHVVPALFGGGDGIVGGAERYAFELARHMAEVTSTTLITFGDRERHDTAGQLKISVIGNPWYVRGQRTNPVALSLISKIRKADVVHCHQQHILSSSMAAVVGRFLGQRVFVSDLGGGGWDLSAYVRTDRWYDGHLHISEYSKNIYGQQNKPWAHVILGGVDTQKFSPIGDHHSENGGWSENKKRTVLFVGRLLPHKGIDDLIKALPPDMPLEVIGQPHDRRYMEELANLAISKQVRFIHDCDDAGLVEAYRRAMCVVLPSVYRDMYGGETKIPELLGQTLLEGMACGTPAICTNVASLPEIVDDGVTGFIVPPNDPPAIAQKLRWLREHPEKAAQMGRAARAHVLLKFTWPQVVKRCLNFYSAH